MQQSLIRTEVMDTIMRKQFADHPAIAMNHVLTILNAIDFKNLKDIFEPVIRLRSCRAGYPVLSM